MNKRIISLFILIIFLLPFSVCAEKSALIENGNFESAHFFWTNGKISSASPYEGLNSCLLSNPIAIDEALFSNTTEYMQPVLLKGKAVYMLQLTVRSDFSQTSLLPDCQVIMPSEDEQIIFQIDQISEEWNKLSVRFMVDFTGEYSLKFNFLSDVENAVVYMDDISLSVVNFSPKKFSIQGKNEVQIPDNGESVYFYAPIALDAQNASVVIRNGYLFINDTLPDGVSFDKSTGRLYVNSSAEPDTTITIYCSVNKEDIDAAHSITVILTKNLINNGTFDDFPLSESWNNESDNFSIESKESSFVAKITMQQELGDFFCGSLLPSQSVFLYASNLYVFRAKVCSEASFYTRNINAFADINTLESTIDICISDIGNEEWTDVVTAFQVPFDGIYNIKLDFEAKDERPVYIDNIVLKPEVEKPSKIIFDVPMHIAIPKNNSLTFPLNYSVCTQMDSICDDVVSFSVFPETNSVIIKENQLIVCPGANEQSYKIIATLLSDTTVTSVRNIFITNDSVGDGSFEYASPGYYWATAQPSQLQFISTFAETYPTHGGLLAKLTMNGSVSVLMSDSVFSYESGCSYVFESDYKMLVPDIDTIVTVLVDNAHSELFEDNLVIGQFTLSDSLQSIQKLFMPSESVTGRIMIAFNTNENHDQQIILMDNISVSKASVYASGVNISGVPALNKNISGKYRFTSNFNAVDSSSFRWLFSDTLNGIYMPLAGETENSLSITSDMLGKYVKFEVTPISLSGPVVGASVTSSPLRIGALNSSNSTDTEVSVEETGDLSHETKPDVPLDPVEPQKPSISKGGMHILDIDKFEITNKQYFFDLNNHWAKNEIQRLNAAGVVQGRGNGLFEPDSLITRAEFSAILGRAFELAPIYYEGQFTDVKYYNWYAGAVAVVTKHGIAQGTGTATFSPDLPITREEMAAMIMRAYRKTNAKTKTATCNFSDIHLISNWAIQDINEASALGIIKGLPDNSFAPSQKATRAEASVCIIRMLTVVSQNI